MQTLLTRGKIRAIGVSNFSVEQMERFRRVAPIHVLQSPYNLFEREIEAEVLPYCRKNNIATFGYGALCRGLLSGRMRRDTVFPGDDLRGIDPKFQGRRFEQYLAAAQRLDQLARRRFGKRLIHLAARWVLDQGVTTALWGARRADQLQPVDEVMGWRLDAPAMVQIDAILRETITDPVGAEFMAPRRAAWPHDALAVEARKAQASALRLSEGRWLMELARDWASAYVPLSCAAGIERNLANAGSTSGAAKVTFMPHAERK